MTTVEQATARWPDGAKYCVHEFLDSAPAPLPLRQVFTRTLVVPRDGGDSYRLRKSGAHIWVFGGFSWWAKAHDRALVCPPAWLP